jgi:hypothetical protein
MRDIDFLPIEHQRERRQQRSQTVQIAAVAVICALTAATALMQDRRRHYVQDELAVIAPAYDAAVRRKAQMNELENQRCIAKADAELYTYLRHPWPRTQLLAALIAPMSDGISLQQVQIVREPPETSTDKNGEEVKIGLPISAQRDLARFRNQMDAVPTTVVLTGTTAETSMLYRYLNDLESVGFFEKADLDWIKNIDNGRGGGVVQFRAIVTVVPSYGLPRGPRGPIEKPRRQDVAFEKKAAEKP